MKMWYILLTLNAIIGTILLEYAWYNTSRHRAIDEEREQRHPAWRRNDVKKWNKLSMYPMAVTFLPFRILSFVGNLAAIYALNKIVLYGIDFRKNEIPPWRRKISKKIFQILCFFN